MTRVAIEPVQPHIDGSTTPSMSEETVDIINPSNGRRLFSMSAGAQADVDRAVHSGRSAFDASAWRGSGPSVRKSVLHRFANLIESHAASLDRLDAEEMGKPIMEARANAASAAGLMRFYAEAVDKVEGDVFGSDTNTLVMQR